MPSKAVAACSGRSSTSARRPPRVLDGAHRHAARFDWHDARPRRSASSQRCRRCTCATRRGSRPRCSTRCVRRAARHGSRRRPSRPTDRRAWRSARGRRTLAARTLLWCGGAWGASRLDGEHRRGGRRSYKPGRLARGAARRARAADVRPVRDAVARSRRRPVETLVGPTREGHRGELPDEPPSPTAIGQLADRVARRSASHRAAGRLARRAARTAVDRRRARCSGVAYADALGSRGFLLGAVAGGPMGGDPARYQPAPGRRSSVGRPSRHSLCAAHPSLERMA